MAEQKTRLGMTATPAGVLYGDMAAIVGVFWGEINKIKAYIEAIIETKEY